jgi:hypothetical protein
VRVIALKLIIKNEHIGKCKARKQGAERRDVES